MPEAIKLVGGPPVFVWSELLNPVDVKPAMLPAKAGIYIVVAFDSQGQRIKQKDEPAHSPLPGVVYIGMTGSSHTLKGRFAALARAWRPNSRQQKPSHGSRAHYNNDPEAQKAFSVENVRLSYQPLPTSTLEEPKEMRDFAAKHGITTDEFREIFGLQKTADERVEAMEAGQIQWFKRQYGYIPILNRDDDGAKDKPPTDAWLDKHLADMERRGI